MTSLLVLVALFALVVTIIGFLLLRPRKVPAPSVAEAPLHAAVPALPEAVAVIDEQQLVRSSDPSFGRLVVLKPHDRRPVHQLLAEAGLPADVVEAVKRGDRLERVGVRIAEDGDRSRRFELTLLPLRHPGCEDCRLLLMRPVADAVDEALSAMLVDPLTGLETRVVLEHALGRSVARAARGFVGHFVHVDLDSFKTVNQMHGRTIGDEVLVAVAEVLRTHVRAGDMVGRLGDDDFGVLLDDTDATAAEALAARLVHVVSGLPAPASHGLHMITASAGVAGIDDRDTVEAVLGRAELALYRARERGGGTVERFDPAVDYLAEQRAVTEVLDLLRSALKGEGLALHFQPIVRLRDGEVAFHEALVRLRKEPGLLMPRDFLPVAQRYRLMPEITRWVVRETLRTLRAHPSMRASVNLGLLDIADPHFPDYLSKAAADAGVSPRRLGVEIKERDATVDLQRTREHVLRLQNEGFRVILDELLSGADSVEHLRELPVDVVKIDRRTVGARTDERGWELRVDVIHQLAESRGIAVVVQCVDDRATEQALVRIGVSYAQGFLFAEPSEAIYEHAVYAV